MPEQTLGGIPLGLGMVMKINFLNFHVHLLPETINHTVKASVTIVHYGKYCTRAVSQALIQHLASPCVVLASRHAPSAIFPLVHSHRCFN